MHIDGEQGIVVNGTRVPPILYGTAWKEDATSRLTALAIRCGFRGIDTANQRKHYHEAGVGEAVQASIDEGVVSRDDLFLQTKFTFRGGQDDRLPYDPRAPIAQQVEQSCESSLAHLGVEQIDSYVLHGPMRSIGLTEGDWQAWQAMERLHDAGMVRMLGVSNVSDEQLETLCAGARIAPTFVQNRCFAVQGWDREVRQLCDARGLIYQGFSLLTANRQVLSHPQITMMAKRLGRTVPQLIFRFAVEVGMLPLTGTTDESHMRSDLDIVSFKLAPDDVQTIETIAERG